MRLLSVSLLSMAIAYSITGCSNNMPSLGKNNPNAQYPMNANAPAYPSADMPRAMPVAPAFNPPKFYRTSYSPQAYLIKSAL